MCIQATQIINSHVSGWKIKCNLVSKNYDVPRGFKMTILCDICMFAILILHVVG